MNRTDFSDEEWQTLQYGPYWAFMAVAAQDSNLDEDEKAALRAALADTAGMSGELGKQVVESVRASESAVFSAWQADDRSPADGFGAINRILARVDADEANRYKGTLVWLAVKVASASGGWFGGTISGRERGAIETVATMLSFNVSDAIKATYTEDVLKALPR
jgi:hypothetical protein